MGQWVFWVWVRFYPKPNFLMGFLVFKSISTQLLDPIHFFGFFWVGLTGFCGLAQPMYTPIGIYQKVEWSEDVKSIFLEPCKAKILVDLVQKSGALIKQCFKLVYESTAFHTFIV